MANLHNTISDPNKHQIKIITDLYFDNRKHYDYSKYSQAFANIITNSHPRFSIGIFGDWGTGKTTIMKMIENELSKNSNILPVWFDPWKYENEKYLAIIPFLRKLSVTIQNKIHNDRSGNYGKWDIVKEGAETTFNALVESIEFSAQLNPGFAHAGVKMNLKDLARVLKNKNPKITINNEQIILNEHITDHLANSLNKLRNKSCNSNAKNECRIVVFIDDLDRCSPPKALEVLESIKIFFDIEGIVYVIGMNHSSLDNIIHEKYGKLKINDEEIVIKGYDYIKKFIQLPFHLPEWEDDLLKKLIEDIIENDLADTHLTKSLTNNKDWEFILNMIVKIGKKNPRQTKTFLNRIILASAISKAEMGHIVVVNALRFNPEWNAFYQIMKIEDAKKKFIENFEKLYESNSYVSDVMINNLVDEMAKEYPQFKNFKSLLQKGQSLRNFLDGGALDILKNMSSMAELSDVLEGVSKIEELKSKIDFVSLGIRLNNQSRFTEAIRAFEDALEINPKNTRALKNLGVSLNNLGRFDEAIDVLDKAIEIDPTFCKAWKNKGVSLRKLGRFDEAIDVLDKAIEIANRGIKEASQSNSKILLENSMDCLKRSQHNKSLCEEALKS